MDIIEAAIWGAVGGVLPDIMKLLRKRFQQRPTYVGRAWYWLNVVLLAIIGAIISVISHPNAIQDALAYGAASLALLTQLFGKDDDQHLGGSGASAIKKIRGWWAS